MDAVTKVPFYGNELIVVEQNGQHLVPMKPIVETLGLSWKNQQELIKRDPILSSVAIVTRVTGSDEKCYEMVCLPLDYLNGWLFKVPVSRYTGEKREIIGKYQRECYKVLFRYFHSGGVINPNANTAQLSGLVDQIVEHTTKAVDESLINRVAKLSVELAMKDVELKDEKRQNHLLMNFAPKGVPGQISNITGRAKDRYVGGYFTSNRSGHPIEGLSIQPQFNF